MSTRAPAPAPAASPAELPTRFVALYEAHYAFLGRGAQRLGASAHEVEDLVQETFIVALRRLEEFDEQAEGRASSWLFAILRNVLRNHARSEQRRLARLDRYSEHPGRRRQSPALDAQAGLGDALLDEFLRTLDRGKREVFVLVELEGMSGVEVARTLGVNVNTAHSRLREARRAFLAHFEDRSAAADVLRGASERRPAGEAMGRGLPIIAATGVAKLGTVSMAGAGVWGLLGKSLFGVAMASLAGLGVLAAVDPQLARPSVEPGHIAAKTAAARAHTPPAQTSPRAAAEPEGRLESAPPLVVEANDAPGSTGEPASLPARARTPAASPKGQQLRPLDRLARARRALLAGEASEALALVAAQRWSATLEPRRIALELAALCQLGRQDEAQARSLAWRRRHPEADGGAVAGLCWVEASGDAAP